jgi:SAM-dependent methyltransferase
MSNPPATESLSPTDRAGSPERFGYEWGKYSELLDKYHEQFRRWTAGLAEDKWKGARFLDVGCGMGRNSFWAMRSGAAGGLAIDLDERSLAQATRNLEPFPAVEVRRQSAYDLDLADDFDIVFSIGVIHHLEHPETALARMFRAAKPGGTGLIWVYGRENNGWIVMFLDPLRKALFSKMPIGMVHFLSLLPTAALWIVLRLGLDRIEYFRLIRQFSFAHLRSIVFDQMLPRIANYWRKAEVEALMRAAGFTDLSLTWVNEMSWTAVGRKPAA